MYTTNAGEGCQLRFETTDSPEDTAFSAICLLTVQVTVAKSFRALSFWRLDGLAQDPIADLGWKKDRGWVFQYPLKRRGIGVFSMQDIRLREVKDLCLII